MENLFGRRLRVVRVARGIQQKELAERIGMSENSISRYEKGIQNPRRTVLIALGKILGVEESYFREEDEAAAMAMLGMSEAEARGMRGLPRGARGVRASEVRLPVLGKVPAGDLEEAIEEAREYIPATPEHAEVADFVLRVEGDSMYPLLMEGDLVGVRVQPVAESGQVVVARVGGEVPTSLQESGSRLAPGEVGTAVKTYRRDSLGARLESMNPMYPPVRGKIEIVGVVTWVHRSMVGRKDRVRV